MIKRPKEVIFKSFFAIVLHILISTGLLAQESITNIVITPKTDGTGMVDIYYDLNGPESAYTITLEVSFDGGSNYEPVDNNCLTRDFGSVQPGTNKYLIWDGICSNPETFSLQTKIKINATFSSGETCGDPITDSRDGQTYNTVQIGNQCWMAENLNIGIRIDGVNEQTNNSQIEKYCYDNDPANCDVYGGLYQWDEMMQYVTTEGVQGICPPTGGWHLPTDNEWKIMEIHLGMTQAQADATGWRGTDEGGKLKESGTIHWNSPNTGATNTSGFTGLPGGMRHSSGSYYSLSNYGYLWSSLEYSSTLTWYRNLAYDNDQVLRVDYYKTYGLSVRCLKDEQNQPPAQPDNPNPTNGEIDTELNTTLSWTCSDPENDPITFDVYFGNSNPPPLVNTSQANTTYDPGTLNLNTTYYWQIIAHDDQTNQTSGSVWSFTTIVTSFQCGDPITDSRDGQTYNTVQIGTQCWMAENLNVGTRIDGVNNQTSNSQIEKYCYDDDPTNCNVYGGLYQWDEMMQYTTTAGVQGICLTGWHLPTDDEWKTMEMYLGMTQAQADATGWRGTDEGGKLKEIGTTHWNTPNTGATNTSGFTALPGGLRYSNWISFQHLGTHSHLWSSSSLGTSAWWHSLHCEYDQVFRKDYGKMNGFSVRCLKD